MSTPQAPQPTTIYVVLLYNTDFPPGTHEHNTYPVAWTSLADANNCAEGLFNQGANQWNIPLRNRLSITRLDGRVCFRGVNSESEAEYVVWVDRVYVGHPRAEEMVREWTRSWQRGGEMNGLGVSVRAASTLTVDAGSQNVDVNDVD